MTCVHSEAGADACACVRVRVCVSCQGAFDGLRCATLVLWKYARDKKSKKTLLSPTYSSSLETSWRSCTSRNDLQPGSRRARRSRMVATCCCLSNGQTDV